MSIAAVKKIISPIIQEPQLIFDLLQDLLAMLPNDTTFQSDCWNVLLWAQRKGNAKKKTVNFAKYQNEELKNSLKLYILHLRMTRNITASSASTIVSSMKYFDDFLDIKSITKLNNGDFLGAEKYFSEKLSKGYAFRAAGHLETFSKWIGSTLGLNISYKATLKNTSYHGRQASDEDRAAKFMSTEVIAKLIGARHNPDLIDKDRLGIAASVIQVATGFRIGELTTLQKDCLIEENGALGVLYFPEKNGVPVPRWIMPSMAEAVRASILTIQDLTENGRAIALETSITPKLDWSRILADAEATEYFVKQFCHEWTSVPENKIFENKGVWVEKYKIYVDLKKRLNDCGGNASELSRMLRSENTYISRGTIQKLLLVQEAGERSCLPVVARNNVKTREVWDTDSRIISIHAFWMSLQRGHREEKLKIIEPIFSQARKLQLSGMVFPKPRINNKMEEDFKIKYRPVVEDSSGRPVLWPHEALFVLAKNQFSKTNRNKEDEFNLVSIGILARWFSGEKRARGTGNFEDSCWSRLGIIDPKTKEIASYTSHDFRHWLNTQVNEGGLSEDQIALMFGRKTISQNAVYDQRSQKVKVLGLQKAIRNNEVLGTITNQYSRIAKESREEAESYLKASTLMVNIMPHGMCSNNWASTPCPHQLSCLSCTDQNQQNSGPCEMLTVDPKDIETKAEIQRLKRNALNTIDVMPSNSPQHNHYVRVAENAEALLNEIESGKKCSRSTMPDTMNWSDDE